MLWERFGMPLLRVNLVRDGLRIAGRRADDPGGAAALRSALECLPSDAPVILLIHGYKFSPAQLSYSPHRHILSPRPAARRPRALSWPRHLGLGRGQGDGAEGLCIAVGWEARGTIWQAYGEAGRAGAALADLIALIHRHRRGPVNALAHSLGARVVLASLAHLAPGDLGRAVLLSGAEFADRAASAMETPAGHAAEIVNVASGENDVFDLMLRLCLRPFPAPGAVLGRGLPAPRANWLDLRIDDTVTRDALASLGLRLPPPVRRVCHWSGYLRPGIFALHRALLRTPAAMPLSVLRLALAEAERPPRPRFAAALSLMPFPARRGTPS
jgi:hypothetical protein